MYILVIFSGSFLSNREKYKNIVENRNINIIMVICWNLFCYISVIIPPDLTFISQPIIFTSIFIFPILISIGLVFFSLGIYLVLKTAMMRRSVGYEDTAFGLITDGLYQHFRHPIYVGISLITLSIPFILLNGDAFLIVPLILFVNFLQGRIEEKYDMSIRFGEQYKEYKKKNHAFGPLWFWLIILIGLLVIDIFIFI